MTDQPTILEAMYESILDGDQDAAHELAQRALQEGMDPLVAVEEGFALGLRRAGELWDEGEFFLPELVTAAGAMKAAMSVLQPALGAASDQTVGRVVLGTVQGDIHDIGKTLVGTLLSANGFEVSDEGADVSIEQFVGRAREIDADLVCASALLTTTMTVQSDLVGALREAGLRARVIVGGAPVSQQWAEQIGADGYADSAVSAVEVAKGLIHDADS